MANTTKDEPKTAPQSDRWYNLTLGPSFKYDSSNKFCTLRYEFKPASIDKSKPGSLHKNKENRVSVEFQNNQPGKSKVTFEGSSEDYKENDAVLFFDGKTFRLERLHRAVKQLRHLRLPGESAAATSAVVAAPSGPVTESRLSPVGKAAKPQHFGKSTFHAMAVEVERIDIGKPDIPGAKPTGKGVADYSSAPPYVSTVSPGPKNYEVEEHQDIVIDDDFGDGTPNRGKTAEQRVDVGFEINVPHQNDTDDEIADVDDSGDEVKKGPNAAEALRAQVCDKGRDDQISSSSSSSGSGSGSSESRSGSGSSSSSSDSDEDSSQAIFRTFGDACSRINNFVRRDPCGDTMVRHVMELYICLKGVFKEKSGRAS